jgi:hypothetical protein
VSFLFCFLARHVGGDKTVVCLKQRKSMVPLPEWNIFEASFFESSELSIWSLVVPLSTSSKSGKYGEMLGVI